MHSELLNLWLFAGVLGKAATMTGIAPGILIFYAARMLRIESIPACIDRATSPPRKVRSA